MSFIYYTGSLRPRQPYVHLWFGPLGLHLFAPDFWKSRVDWQRDWRG